MRGSVSHRTLAAWAITGAAILLVLPFAFMPYWMNMVISLRDFLVCLIKRGSHI